jgi:SAM-dependent methyltransferase
MKVLDLGCGKKKYPGSIGVDINPDSDADIIYDLNYFPYPFRSNTFDLIICDNVLEHLDNPLLVMEEIHRILKSGGVLKIIVPHFSSDDSYSDITHRHYFSFRSFDIFAQNTHHFYFYTNVRFDIVDKKIVFGRLMRYIGIEFIANRFPSIYEAHFAFIFQAYALIFEMRAIK